MGEQPGPRVAGGGQKGLQGFGGLGKSIQAGDHAPGAFRRVGRDQAADFVRPHQFFVGKAQGIHMVDPFLKNSHGFLVRGNAHLTHGAEVAILAHDFGQFRPEIHGGHGQGDFFKGPVELAHAPCIHGRGVAGGEFLFQEDDLFSGPGQIQGGGGPHEAGTDDDHICFFHYSPSNWAWASSIKDRFRTGGRMLKAPTSRTAMPR